MSELLKKQKFGVEVEFTGITRTMAAEAVAEILGSHATGPDRTCYRTYTIRDSKRRIWKVMRDSSICPVRKWIEGYLLDGGMPGEKRIFIGKLVIGKWTIMADEFDEVDPDTICEYTGLTDKNGKKIWENDIVLVTNKNYCSGKIESSIGNIFFTFGTWYIGGKTQDRLYSINNDTIFQIEVVGNIFDNPELLQGSL